MRAAPIFITLLFLMFFCVAFAAVQHDEVLWRLDVHSAKPGGCAIHFISEGRDSRGNSCMQADTRNSNTPWNSCVLVPAGLLQKGEDYVITVRYEVVERSEPGAYFYVFARSNSLGDDADKWQKWRGESGDTGIATLHISPTAQDYGLCMGIHGRGVMRILGAKLEHGDGMSSIPLDSSFGGDKSIAMPRGAVPFQVKAPANVDGPVVDLADFGIEAENEVKPSSTPEKNSEALKAAVAKCLEMKASRLTVPKGIYRISSPLPIEFKGLKDFTFEGNGSTFLFDQPKGNVAFDIKDCQQCVFSNFNVDWDWKKAPLAAIGKIVKVAPDLSFFEMRFEVPATFDPKLWNTLNPLDKKLLAPGAGHEYGGFGPKKVEMVDRFTARVWPSYGLRVKEGELYLLRHYVYLRHCISMTGNAHLSIRDVTVYSFPGIAFIVGGDQHHFELLRCRVTYPENQRRPITATSDCFHVDQSQGFMRLENCDFGYSGDDCVNIHDKIFTGVTRVDDHTLLATKLLLWQCPFAAGDEVELRNANYSPTGFKGLLKDVKSDYKTKQVVFVFEDNLPAQIASDSIVFNHRYNSRNFIILNCNFHENRARGMLCNTADGLVEHNRFFHNQGSAILCLADVGPTWCEGFGAQNIVFRENLFEQENSGGSANGATIATYANNNGVISTYPVISNILIENNTFKETFGPILYAQSFKNISLVKNTVLNIETPPLEVKMRGSIVVQNGNTLAVEDNSWSSKNCLPKPELLFAPDSARGLSCQNNALESH